ncbi:hypothetical protein [Streptomyces goshikiensis]|uniref:hypothetical protein n=1 Tax=Streptomyces goshikiensis TaxID=1942 RepID=UPI0036689BDD
MAALQVRGERLQPIRFYWPVRIGRGPPRELAEGTLIRHVPQQPRGEPVHRPNSIISANAGGKQGEQETYGRGASRAVT